jgi:hypothetical protein
MKTGIWRCLWEMVRQGLPYFHVHQMRNIYNLIWARGLINTQAMGETWNLLDMVACCVATPQFLGPSAHEYEIVRKNGCWSCDALFL